MFKRISARDAATLISDNAAQIVDTRDEMSYLHMYLQCALNLNTTKLQAFIESADIDKPVIVYCYHGISSQSAAEFLCQKGFEEVYSLEGGFAACHGILPTSR